MEGTKNKKNFFLLKILGILLVYFISGKLGLLLAFINPSTTALWPPTGIAVAGFLLLGYRLFPAIFIGAFLVNITTAGSLTTSLGIALGNTLEGLVGAYLVNRFASGYHFFEKARDIFKFCFFAGIFSTMVSASIGTTTLLLGGYLPPALYQSTWITWWLGDAGGALVFAPLFIIWATKRKFLLSKKRIFEAFFLLIALFGLGEIIFGGILPFPYALPYLCIPVLIWIALRRTQTETVTSILLIFIIATGNTLYGFGPFALEGVTANQSLLLLQMFLGTVSIMTLSVSSVVADRKKTEELRRRLATIVNASDDAIYSMTLDGIVTTWNRGAVKMLGYTPEEMIGRPINHIFPKNKKNELQRIITITKKGKSMLPYETERRKKDGIIIPVSIAISPLKDIYGNTIEISKIARDISREKELEKRKDEFISMASHELNTPIAGLSIYVQTLAKLFEKKNDKQSSEYLAKMDGQIQRIRHIIRDLLDISRIRLGALSFHYTKFKMHVLVKEIVEVAQYLSKNHTIIMHGDVKETVFGDRDRISQVLLNLLSNARKYSPAGKKIVVTITANKHEIIVAVQDFGIGIAKRHQKRVFELFYRIQEYHGRTFPGMGIGLYLSFQIIDEHKGRMWFVSTKGEGTTFYFSLPIKKLVVHKK